MTQSSRAVPETGVDSGVASASFRPEPISDNALAALRLGVGKSTGIARIEKVTMQSLLARLDEAMAALREKEERVKALEAKVASVCGTANRMRDQRDEARDGAYEFVADWHERQAKLFREMADDEPRTADAARKRAGEAAVHHAASAAALRNRAADDRRARSLSSAQPVSGSREQRGNEEGAR